MDTSIFKAHSVCGASSTAAAEKGVLIADILCTADWSKDSTFKRFYYRPSAGSGYAQTVLQQKERGGEGKGPLNGPCRYMGLYIHIWYMVWTLCHHFIVAVVPCSTQEGKPLCLGLFPVIYAIGVGQGIDL